MQIHEDELQQRFASLDAESLQEHWRLPGLSEQARRLLQAEFLRRGLLLPALPASAYEETVTTAGSGSAMQADDQGGPTATTYDADSRRITLARYLNVLEARIHCALLRSEGLRAELADEHTAVTDNYMFHAIGGVRLQVAASEASQAQDILLQVRRGERTVRAADLEGLDLPPPPPALSTDDAALLPTRLILLILVALLTTYLLS